MARASSRWLSSADAPAPPIGFPEEIKRALESHDWRLRCVWNPIRYLWEVWVLRRMFPAHPHLLEHGPAMGIDRRYWMVRMIATPTGEPRTACWRDYEIIRDGEFNNMSPRDVVEEALRPERERQADADRTLKDASDEAAKHLHAGLYLNRVSRGYEPEGARRW